MSLILFVPDPNTLAGKLNPVAKLTGLVVISLPLLSSRDVATSGIMVGLELLAFPLLGLGPRLLVRAWPLLLGLGSLWLANYLVSGSVTGLVAVSLRLLALGLPGLVLVLSTDPVDLADALVQKWHAPPRWAYGALAAFRLLPLLAIELGTIRRARRARGVGVGITPLGWLRTAFALLFALLVQAIRRGVRLAAAMDSRGFDEPRARRAVADEPQASSGTQRSFARESVLRRRDWVYMGCCCAAITLALAVSVTTGHFRLLFG